MEVELTAAQKQLAISKIVAAFKAYELTAKEFSRLSAVVKNPDATQARLVAELADGSFTITELVDTVYAVDGAAAPAEPVAPPPAAPPLPAPPPAGALTLTAPQPAGALTPAAPKPAPAPPKPATKPPKPAPKPPKPAAATPEPAPPPAAKRAKRSDPPPEPYPQPSAEAKAERLNSEASAKPGEAHEAAILEEETDLAWAWSELKKAPSVTTYDECMRLLNRLIHAMGPMGSEDRQWPRTRQWYRNIKERIVTDYAERNFSVAWQDFKFDVVMRDEDEDE